MCSGTGRNRHIKILQQGYLDGKKYPYVDIIKAVTRPDSSYILVGDMNDHCESEFLLPFTVDEELGLTNALADMAETGKMNKTKYPPAHNHWTPRYSPQSGVYHYNLYDQIWISPALQIKQTGAWVGRRKYVGGDGSNHDPLWIELDL